MKKFERLPVEERQNEIMHAAIGLFLEKGFKATTMENIVSKTTLSKGGVYRIYPSTTAILSDIMIHGMHMRNAFYEEYVKKLALEGKALTLPDLVHMIASSLLLSPEVSRIYVEFLWEKQRNEELEKLYEDIENTTIVETNRLISKAGLEGMLPENGEIMKHLQDLMNSAILSMHTLSLFPYFETHMEAIEKAITTILLSEMKETE